MTNKPNYPTLLEASSLVNFTAAAVSSVTSNSTELRLKRASTYSKVVLNNFARCKTVKGVLPNNSKTERQDFPRLILLT